MKPFYRHMKFESSAANIDSVSTTKDTVAFTHLNFLHDIGMHHIDSVRGEESDGRQYQQNILIVLPNAAEG